MSPSMACRATYVVVACKTAAGVSTGEAGTVRGMEFENSLVTAIACAARRAVAAVCTACGTGASTNTDGTDSVGGKVTKPMLDPASLLWAECGMVAGTGVGRASAAGGRVKGPVATAVSAA